MNQLEVLGLFVVLGMAATVIYETWEWFRKRRKARKEEDIE